MREVVGRTRPDLVRPRMSGGRPTIEHMSEVTPRVVAPTEADLLRVAPALRSGVLDAARLAVYVEECAGFGEAVVRAVVDASLAAAASVPVDELGDELFALLGYVEAQVAAQVLSSAGLLESAAAGVAGPAEDEVTDEAADEAALSLSPLDEPSVPHESSIPHELLARDAPPRPPEPPSPGGPPASAVPICRSTHRDPPGADPARPDLRLVRPVLVDVIRSSRTTVARGRAPPPHRPAPPRSPRAPLVGDAGR